MRLWTHLRRPKLGAGVLVFDLAGNVLLTRVRRRRAWEYPGGWLRRGETPREGAVRELREEVGIELGPSALHEVARDTLLGPQFRTYVARVTSVEPTITLAHLELSNGAWCDPEVARRLIRPELLPRLMSAYASPWTR